MTESEANGRVQSDRSRRSFIGTFAAAALASVGLAGSLLAARSSAPSTAARSEGEEKAYAVASSPAVRRRNASRLSGGQAGRRPRGGTLR